MAIKIIREGNVKKKFKVTCKECDCEFEYEEEDLKVDYSICLTTYPCKYSTYVVCPCCGKHIHHGYTHSVDYPNYIPNISLENRSIPCPCDSCPYITPPYVFTSATDTANLDGEVTINDLKVNKGKK